MNRFRQSAVVALVILLLGAAGAGWSAEAKRPAGQPAPTPTPGTTSSVPPGGSSGDPHLHTPDGLDYDFQAAGEFVLVASAAGELVVQVRQEPLGASTVVSVTTAVAMNVAGDRVGVALGAELTPRVNGQPTPLGDAPQALPNGGRTERRGNRVAVVWPDGSEVEIAPHSQFLDVVVRLAPGQAGRVAGLLGNADGNPANDLTARDGRVIQLAGLAAETLREQLYGVFGASWRIGAAEALFDYGPGEDAGRYTRLEFPSALVGVSDLAPGARAAAEAVCAAAGVPTGAFRNDCLLDVGLTGDPAFAEGAAAMAAAFAPTGGGLYRAERAEPGFLAWVTLGNAAGWEVSAFRAEVRLDLTGNQIVGAALSFDVFSQAALDRGEGDTYRSRFEADALKDSGFDGAVGGLWFVGASTSYEAPPKDPQQPTVVPDSEALFVFALDDAGRLILCPDWIVQIPDRQTWRSECLANPIAVLDPVAAAPA